MSVDGSHVRIGSCILAGDMDIMVRFYRDTLGFQTQWDGGDFAEFETAGGELSFWLYSRKEFVKAIGENYIPPKGINQTFEIALWLPSFADVDAEYERLSKFRQENLSPILLVFATFMLPTRRAIYLKSAVQENCNATQY